ncbi:MAG: hypothetical protein HY290_02175 [Planctomycetia bacterium]|nr:hypothetical protein [Planctomycetia bacterium]
MPALVAALRANYRDLSDDDVFAHLFAFLCLWLAFVVSLAIGLTRVRRTHAELARVSIMPGRWKVNSHRLMYRAPRTLRWFVVGMFGVWLYGITQASLPLCRHRTLVWSIEREGAEVHSRAPRFNVPLGTFDRWLGFSHSSSSAESFAIVTCSGTQVNDASLGVIADNMCRLGCQTELRLNQPQITDSGFRLKAALGFIRGFPRTTAGETPAPQGTRRPQGRLEGMGTRGYDNLNKRPCS